MNWKEIKVSNDNNFFLYKEQIVYNKIYDEVLKFHAPGLAPVKDITGAFHIDINGKELYAKRYNRTFGYYCNRAAVIQNKSWFHLTENGYRAYNESYAWAGNYQENLCTVRNNNNKYFHIQLNGVKAYINEYSYSGDFKDGYACVKLPNGLYKHIDVKGNFLNNQEYLDLGVFHKNYATAKDENGWFHIKKDGCQLYNMRYALIEPFYNGFAVVDTFEKTKQIISENAEIIVKL